jgi:hypothetical protein
MLKHFLAIAALLIIFPAEIPAVDQQTGRTSFNILAVDPAPGSTLAAGDKLYVHIRYDSPVPVRFVAQALRQETLQEDAFTSSTPPYDAGHGEAMVWVGFPRPIRIDELRVTAFDMDWHELGTRFDEAVITWEEREDEPPRQPASWVNLLLKRHRHVFDNNFDPQPKKPAPLFDVFLLLSFMAMPLYLLMQIQMLIRYRGSWQWYASAPLHPILPLALYSAFGLGLSTELWVIFIFRYMSVALVYLLILWVVRRKREKPKLPGNPQETLAEGSE